MGQVGDGELGTGIVVDRFRLTILIGQSHSSEEGGWGFLSRSFDISCNFSITIELKNNYSAIRCMIYYWLSISYINRTYNFWWRMSFRAFFLQYYVYKFLIFNVHYRWIVALKNEVVKGKTKIEWVFRYLEWWVLPREFRTLKRWHTEAEGGRRIIRYKAMAGTEAPSVRGAKEGVCELYPQRSLNGVCFPKLLASWTLCLCHSFCHRHLCDIAFTSVFSISLCALLWFFR